MYSLSIEFIYYFSLFIDRIFSCIFFLIFKFLSCCLINYWVFLRHLFWIFVRLFKDVYVFGLVLRDWLCSIHGVMFPCVFMCFVNFLFVLFCFFFLFLIHLIKQLPLHLYGLVWNMEGPLPISLCKGCGPKACWGGVCYFSGLLM